MVTPALVVRRSWSEIFEVFELFSTRPVGRLSARRPAKPGDFSALQHFSLSHAGLG